MDIDKGEQNSIKDNCSRNRLWYGDPLRYLSCPASVTETNIHVGHIKSYHSKSDSVKNNGKESM